MLVFVLPQQPYVVGAVARPTNTVGAAVCNAGTYLYFLTDTLTVATIYNIRNALLQIVNGY
jgi:hypothetical protein